jgi:hypothetical protein
MYTTHPPCAPENEPQIYELREVAEELLALLPSDDSAEPAVVAAFAPLQQLRPHALAASCSEVAEAAWRGAVSEFDARMAAVESRVVARLRELLGTSLLPSLAAATAAVPAQSRRGQGKSGSTLSASGAPMGAAAGAQAHQVLSELRSFGALLARPNIGGALLPERRTLAKHVSRGRRAT